jgi:exo-beta-1,3-glucanase (GH17 family)
MGVYTDVQMNAYYTPTVHSGATAIRVSYTASDTTGLRWGGAAWLDPEGNWSGATGGFYLRGTTELAFWAKGERGGERVKFGMGGVPDGAPARYIVVALSDQWQRYTIPLNGLNVDQVIEGFYWAANCDDNPNGATFYLDDIQYLYQSNNAVYVYQDQFSLDNFYVPSGWMGDLNQIHIDEGVPDSTYPGATTTRFTYDSASGTNDWAGVYYLWPDNNWGTDPAGGHSLAGAKQLAVRMRGARGGERITIGMGGVTGAYGDSTGKHERTITLSSNWQEYTIDLTGTNLSRVVGGFYWSASRYWNPGGATFYLDDVRYVFEDTPWPHLISSYVGDPTQPDDQYFAGSAHIYDNALAILAFLARGTTADIRQARAMADALVYVQNHDPSFTDGRLRSAYHAEALSGSGGIAWYWNDAYGAGTHVGNMSWVILALTRMYQTTGEAQYRDAAIRLGNWIHDHTYDERFYGGYTGGYEGWEPAQIRLDWKSTEHNIDAYVAFATLYDITHETKWWEHALHAKRFVRSMWFENTLGGGTPVGWFWTGTKGDFLVYGDWEPTVVVSNTCQAPTVTMPHNHYYPTRFGPALENIQLSTNYTATAHSGESSLRLVYPAGTSDWAGLIALEGDHNWGTAGQGYDMVGARSLTVWMKSVVGGEKVVIGIGGVPYTTTTLPVSTTLPGTYASALTQTAILTTNWQPYTITIPPTHTLDMQHHIGGFFAYLSPADNPTGAEILLDDIVYHFDDSLGEMLNYNVLVADVNSWGLMALGEQLRYGKTVDWIHHAFLVTETIASQAVSGIDFDIDKDGIWPEGTGQAILAFQATGRQSWSTTILSDAAFVQEHAPRANRKGIVAALHDCLTTNLGWFYYNRLHVAPTAWYIFAMRGHNPYWGIPITAVRRQGPVIQFITYTYPSTYLLLQGSNFNAPTVTLESPFSSTMLLGVSAFTSTTLTATLPTPLSPGTAYTITVISPDTQQDRKTFTVGCLPVAGTRFTYRHLALDTFVFSATVAAGYPPLTYTWDWGEPSSLPLHGIAYGPFRDGQRPGGLLPSETELREDLDILSRHSDHIRLYGTQEATPDIVRIAAEKGISITLGAWIDTDTITNELELASLISLTNHYSNVVAATVGNERLLFHEISETQLISYIQQVRQAVDVPVSTAETWDVWLAHPQLADAVDFLLVHIHPYWEGVPVERAVEQVANHYAQLQAAYPGKPIVIGETGWPTSGDDYGAAHPGEAEQQQFVEAFTAWARANNVSYFYFDAFDEAWKCDPGPAVECHWGLYTTGRQPKPVVATRAITTVSVITHTFSAPGNYNVTLVVNNRCGQDVYSDTIFVGHPSKIFLPLVIR